MLLKPTRLDFGDTLGIVAPASAPADLQVFEKAEEIFTRLGFKFRLAPNARRRRGFLAGTDRERASDIMAMVSDRRIKAILCLRGGYGSARLLELLDYDKIHSCPKIFVGYSDITSLHCAFLVRSRLLTFHGPMFASDLSRDDLPAFTKHSFLRTLMQPSPVGSISEGYHRRTISVIRGGVARGRLMGGNLSILCASLGTPFQPSFRKAILCFEDLDEVPYRFDRMLTQLLNAGLLHQVAGIAIGINKNCQDPRAKQSHEYRQTLNDVLAERLSPLKVPVVSGLPFGHVPYNATLPIGASATLDGNRGDLIINEAAVM